MSSPCGGQTLDQNKTVINSLKSEVNRLTQNNAKLESRVTVDIAPNKTDVPTQTAHQQSSGYQTNSAFANIKTSVIT